MGQDDELGAGLDVTGIVFSEALVKPLIRLHQTQNLQVVLLLQNRTEEMKK